jgi:hypothetical protein
MDQDGLLELEDCPTRLKIVGGEIGEARKRKVITLKKRF